MTGIGFEHATDHPVGAQSGPGGLHAWFCKREDCDWRQIAGPDRPALDIHRTPDDAGYLATALTFAVCIFGTLALLAAITVGRHAMCATHHDGQGHPTLSYCEGWHDPKAGER